MKGNHTLKQHTKNISEQPYNYGKYIENPKVSATLASLFSWIIDLLFLYNLWFRLDDSYLLLKTRLNSLEDMIRVILF